MPVVSLEKLISLQRDPNIIRNICILAHVDHGKTSLTDSLIATNGIISQKLAGKIRYLDSRPDEQLRGITMESSAISLFFDMFKSWSPDAAPSRKDFLINLIDSPGHIDFSSEVSTASRLCDGALVLVDAVEGVCSQTVTVLRHTWTESLKPLLVINKMDRLVTELKMSPEEAYSHLSKLVEQVNAVIGSFYQGERMEEDLLWREKMEERVAAAALSKQERAEKRAAKSTNDEYYDGDEDADDENAANNFEEKDDEDLYFSPEKRNVIFCSAIDGWAFTVRQFAGLYERKLGIKRSLLEKVLWGDFYLDPKTKRVLASRHLKGRSLKPIFVTLVLENIWAVYDATMGGPKGKGDPYKVDKIKQALNLSIPKYMANSKDPRAIMTSLFSSWLPLHMVVLSCVCEYLPALPQAQAERLPSMIEHSPGATHVDPLVRDAMVDMKSFDDDPVVAFVSKMVSIPESELPQNKRKTGGSMTSEEARDLARKKRAELAKAHTLEQEASIDAVDDSFGQLTTNGTDSNGIQPEEKEHLIGFARIYSGNLKVGDSIYVLPPKFTPAKPHAPPQPQKVTVAGLYLLMGRGLETLAAVSPGVICGIAGLDGHVLKSATLCSQLEGSVNLAGVNMGGEPIVRVALEPANPADLDKMIRAMKLLEQSDPCARYEVLENGEHVILTAGELHLERCLKDLRERFARCEIQAGEPIVPYRETIVDDLDMLPPKNKDLPRGTVTGVTTSKQVIVRLRGRPLPNEVTEFLTKHTGVIRRLYSEKKATKGPTQDETEQSNGQEDPEDDFAADQAMSLESFRDELRTIFAKANQDTWSGVVDKIAAFGPRRIGPNLLVDSTGRDTCEKFLDDEGSPEPKAEQDQHLSARAFSDKIAHAFQLATSQGPMCHEPIQGIAVFLEEVTLSTPSETGGQNDIHESTGRLTGEIIKTTSLSIHTAFLSHSPRLLLAMYTCEISCSADVLGKVYTVLSRRHGTILTESLKEGTPFYSIVSHLPVAESFGFAEEVRKKTSGAAQPQLVFSGFELLDEDPFWEPRTEEELEDFGALGDRERVSKKYVDGVRRRKGMVVKGQRVVRDAEKQKTLKR